MPEAALPPADVARLALMLETSQHENFIRSLLATLSRAQVSSFHLMSTGYVSNMVSKLPGEIDRAAAAIGICVFSIDNVPHYAEEDVSKIRDHFKYAGRFVGSR